MIGAKGKQQLVLEYLLSGVELTRQEAIKRFNCANLPSMVSKFRARGYKVKMTMRDGFAVYQLEAPDVLTLPLFGE